MPIKAKLHGGTNDGVTVEILAENLPGIIKVGKKLSLEQFPENYEIGSESMGLNLKTEIYRFQSMNGQTPDYTFSGCEKG